MLRILYIKLTRKLKLQTYFPLKKKGGIMEIYKEAKIFILMPNQDQDTLLRNSVSENVAQRIQKYPRIVAQKLWDTISYSRSIQDYSVKQQARNEVSEKSQTSWAKIPNCFATVARQFRDTIVVVSGFPNGYGKHDRKSLATRLICCPLVCRLLAYAACDVAIVWNRIQENTRVMEYEKSTSYWRVKMHVYCRLVQRSVALAGERKISW